MSSTPPWVNTLLAMSTWTCLSVALFLFTCWFYDLLYPFIRRRGQLFARPVEPPTVGFNPTDEEEVVLNLLEPIPENLRQAPLNVHIGPAGAAGPDIRTRPPRVVSRPLLPATSRASMVSIYDFRSRRPRSSTSAQEFEGVSDEAPTGVPQSNIDTTWQQRALLPGTSRSGGGSEMRTRRRRGFQQNEPTSTRVDILPESFLSRTQTTTITIVPEIHREPSEPREISLAEIPRISIFQPEQTDQSGLYPPRSEDVDEDRLQLPKVGTPHKGSPRRSSGSSGSSRESYSSTPEKDSSEKVERSSSEKSSPGKSSTSSRGSSPLKAADEAPQDGAVSSPAPADPTGSKKETEKDLKGSLETSGHKRSSSDVPSVHHLPGASTSQVKRKYEKSSEESEEEISVRIRKPRTRSKSSPPSKLPKVDDDESDPSEKPKDDGKSEK